MIVQLLLIFLLVLYIKYSWRVLKLRAQLPPGPFPLPVIGNLLAFDPTRPQIACRRFTKKYGPVFTIWAGSIPLVIVTDYELMKDAFVKNGDQLSSRPRSFLIDYFLKGNYGLIFATGDLWREQRRFVLQTFRNFGLGRSLMEERIMIEARKLCTSLKADLKMDGYMIMDMHTHIQFCVGNIVAAILFGQPFEKGEENVKALLKTLDENFKIFGRLRTVFILDSFPWLRHVPIMGHFGADDLTAHRDYFYHFLKKHLDSHQKDFENNAARNDQPTDFIEAYLREMKRREDEGEDLSSFSEWQLIWTLGDLVVAGMETTVSTLRWAIMAMMLNPKVQQKVQQEIDAVLGREVPTMADRQNLPYVMATINEAQRWGNIIPINIPHTNDKDFNLSGYTIPEGVMVIAEISTLAMDETVFPEPEKFQPERFLMPDLKTPRKIDQFAPFSMGKRQCMGEALARAELFLIFTMLMQNFVFAVPPGYKKPSTVPVMRTTAAPGPHECMVMLRSATLPG